MEFKSKKIQKSISEFDKGVDNFLEDFHKASDISDVNIIAFYKSFTDELMKLGYTFDQSTKFINQMNVIISDKHDKEDVKNIGIHFARSADKIVREVKEQTINFPDDEREFIEYIAYNMTRMCGDFYG